MAGLLSGVQKIFSRVLAVLIIIVLVIIIPSFIVYARFSNDMYSSVEELPVKEYGVLFGARVYGENRLTDAAKERADASVLLYKEGKVQKVFVSGDNDNDQEAENLAKYLISNGVHSDDILIDKLGLDTLGTCKNLEAAGIKEATLITQSFHLPRAMLFCQNKVVSLSGVKANSLGLLENRGSDTFQIYYIRTIRFFRESLLIWSYILGVYQRFSDGANPPTSIFQ